MPRMVHFSARICLSDCGVLKGFLEELLRRAEIRRFWNVNLSGESRNAVTGRALVEYPVEAFGYAPIYASVCSKPDPGFVICGGITECPRWCIFQREFASRIAVC